MGGLMFLFPFALIMLCILAVHGFRPEEPALVPVFLSAAYRLQPAVPSDIEEQIEKLTAQPPSKKTLTIDVR